MKEQTHYGILGVTQAATNAELKNAYRRLVKKYHPDVSHESDAVARIRYINEAYEVLSEHYSRAAYDRQLSGAFQTPTYKPPEETEAEKYRREYLRKKAHQDRVNLESLLKLKIKFYRFQRIVCYLFFASGILFTVDYYFSSYSSDHEIETIKKAFRKTEITTSVGSFKAEEGLFQEYRRQNSQLVTITFSSIFEIPMNVRLKGSGNLYEVIGTLHGFGNVFSLIVLIFSGIVVRHKEYSDFRLTSGIIPGFLVPFMYLMAMSGG